MNHKEYKKTKDDLPSEFDIEADEELTKRVEELFYCATGVIHKIPAEGSFIFKKNGEFEAITFEAYYEALIPPMRLATAQIDNPNIDYLLGRNLYTLALKKQGEEKYNLCKESLSYLERAITSKDHTIRPADLYWIGLLNDDLAQLTKDKQKRYQYHKEGLTTFCEYITEKDKNNELSSEDCYLWGIMQLNFANFMGDKPNLYQLTIASFKKSLSIEENSTVYKILGNTQLKLATLVPERSAELARHGMNNIEKGAKMEHME